jgi:hypothetical protein
MARKKLTRLLMIDPDVTNLLKDMERRQFESQLPRREKEKKTREREKINARRDRRVTYDLPPEIRNRVMILSEQLSIPASQLVTLALVQFLEEYDSEKIDLSIYKIPSRSPRYDWNLIIPNLLTGNDSKKKKDSSSLSNKVVKK